MNLNYNPWKTKFSSSSLSSSSLCFLVHCVHQLFPCPYDIVRRPWRSVSLLTERCHRLTCSNSDCSCVVKRGHVLENERFRLVCLSAKLFSFFPFFFGGGGGDGVERMHQQHKFFGMEKNYE